KSSGGPSQTLCRAVSATSTGREECGLSGSDRRQSVACMLRTRSAPVVGEQCPRGRVIVRDSRSIQRGKILALLISAQGQEVPLPKITACAAQYNARIFELRRLGFRIPPPRIQLVGGKKHSW